MSARRRVTDFVKGKGPYVWVTAYDYPTAKIVDEAGVDGILVGDSLGMVVLGLPNTLGVTLADMIRHTQAVARARPRALVVADMSLTGPVKGSHTPSIISLRLFSTYTLTSSGTA